MKLSSNASTQRRSTSLSTRSATRCTALRESVAHHQSRREIIRDLAGLVVALNSLPLLPAHADEDEAVFYGLATPPTSYGGYGGNDFGKRKESAKYTFVYPSQWKEEVPSKVEKGTQGIDGRVAAPKSKDLSAFVITLGRAGEDNKSFIIRDTESTFAGFAGADYRLQDAIQSATNISKSTREENGTTFYEFDIDSPDYRYLSSIAVKDGKVFALFVRSPSRTFKKEEAKLRKMISTFTLL